MRYAAILILAFACLGFAGCQDEDNQHRQVIAKALIENDGALLASVAEEYREASVAAAMWCWILAGASLISLVVCLRYGKDHHDAWTVLLIVSATGLLFGVVGGIAETVISTDPTYHVLDNFSSSRG